MIKKIKKAAKKTDELFSEFCGAKVSPVYSRIKPSYKELKKAYNEQDIDAFSEYFKEMLNIITTEINEDFVDNLCKGTHALYEDLYGPMERSFFTLTKKLGIGLEDADYMLEELLREVE